MSDALLPPTGPRVAVVQHTAVCPPGRVGDWLVAEGWYSELGMYGPDRLMLIQERGASIMWAISEVPTVGYAIIVAVLWMKSEDRRARQYDRKAERDGGAELAAYNAYLESLRGGGGAPAPTAGADSPGDSSGGSAPDRAGERRDG